MSSLYNLLAEIGSCLLHIFQLCIFIKLKNLPITSRKRKCFLTQGTVFVSIVVLKVDFPHGEKYENKGSAEDCFRDC